MFHRKQLSVWVLTFLWVASWPVRAQLPDFTDLVKKNGAAVVNISTTQKAGTSDPRLPDGLQIPEGTPFDDFLRRFFGEQGHGFQPRQSKSLGSGFIISADGYVLTNHHVVADADEIIVRLQDRRELVAKLIGSDERSDIALLRIDADNLPVVKIGSENTLEVGEWVLAIGSPFGFEHSVTAGIVSAKGRSLPSDSYVPFIQTDVAINPGNSGGPLFNLDGEVVGINSQIYSRTGGFMGLSFAIPMSIAMNIVEQLKDHGSVNRGWLGVQVQDVTRELAESFGMQRPHGALVARVLPNSPAEKAGFLVGDVIVDFNGQEIETSASLPPIVGMTPIGEKVPVSVVRQKHPMTLTVEIGKLSPEVETQMKSDNLPAISVKRLGIKITAVADEPSDRKPGSNPGVLVRELEKGPAMDAGIQEGDVILRIQNEDIISVEQFMEVIKSLPSGRPVAVLVQRQGSPVFLAIKIDD
ncbi:MAG: DegQ family serine endoprotease [Methylococcaceae bacterium]|nr:DegQ family serine endoprotease [Methylococcaceae bacterium]